MTKKQKERNIKNEDAYLKAILDKYEKERYQSLNYYLAEPTSGSIRSKILSMLKKGENIDFENALKGFLGEHKITDRKELIDIADKSITKYRAIRRLLLGDTGNGKNNADLLRLTAFLVELEQKESDKPVNEIHNKTSKIIFHLAIVSVVCISIPLILSIIKENPIITPADNTTNHNKVTIENLFVTPNDRIFPDEKTTFFNERGEPKLWYATNNDQYEFYNKQGKHYQTKEPLKVVTREVFNKYQNNDTSTQNKDEKDVIKNSVSMFLFNEANTIDPLLTSIVKKKLSQEYTVISSVLSKNDEIIGELKIGNINRINSVASTKTEYVCVGNVDYSFSENTVLENYRKCTMTINYSIISTKTNAIIDTYNEVFTGAGKTDALAKQTTINKIKL